MKKIIVAVPHSHTWFWTQTCAASLCAFPPHARGYEVDIVFVDNSPWSPAIRGVTDTKLGDKIHVIPNHKSNKFHASALDCIVDDYQFDLLMALETDVIALGPDWLQWFINHMRLTDFAVGMWHHEQFVNPSCTLYNGDVLRDMNAWCKNHPAPNELRWGPVFANTAPLDNNLPLNENPEEVLKNIKDWIAGPFAEKRGWPIGTMMKEAPSGQLKGPGWYEPGQQLHHWAVKEGYTYTLCPTLTTFRSDNLPLQTLYGPVIPDPQRQLEASELLCSAQTAHLWGGTRALDILKHPVTCNFVKSNTPDWLAREARFWRSTVPQDVRDETIKLIQKYGWHITGQGNAIPGGDERDHAAVDFIRECYEAGGVTW